MTPSQYRLAAELVGMIHEDFQGFHPGYRDAGKPGGAENMRKKMTSDSNFAGQNQVLVDRLGTVHDLRFLIFDNDTRLLFASTFDGDWDAYIDDFAAHIPEVLHIFTARIQMHQSEMCGRD